MTPPVALTAGSLESFWPNWPEPADGVGGGMRGRIAGTATGPSAWADQGSRRDFLDQDRVELIDPRDDDLVADGFRRSMSGTAFLVGCPERLAIPARPVVEQRDRPEVFAAADGVGVRVVDRGSPPEWRSSNTPPPRA